MRQQALPDLAGREQPLVDAWYLDGFAPSRNATMWTAPLLHAAAALSRPGASFATFTVAGQVRRNLADAGFQVEQGSPATVANGNACAAYSETADTRRTQPPLTLGPSRRTPDRPAHVLVVGGGLAGCAAAAALARRGSAVTLLEQGALANGRLRQ